MNRKISTKVYTNTNAVIAIPMSLISLKEGETQTEDT